MFVTPITTPELQRLHALVPVPFIEEGEVYQPPEPTVRNKLISTTINDLRKYLTPYKPALVKHMAVTATVTDITDLVNCGLCHVFATLVRGHLELLGVETVLQGDPFHVWLYDPIDRIHYDAFFTLGTRYRADLDGGYCADHDSVEPWGRDRVSSEYRDYESKLRAVCATIRENDPDCYWLVSEALDF